MQYMNLLWLLIPVNQLYKDIVETAGETKSAWLTNDMKESL